MEWNVKNAINRDVERQHLNKILKEIHTETSDLRSIVSRLAAQNDPRDVVGGMVSGNTEVGINVSYNFVKKVIDFALNPLTVRLIGDVTGQATTADLGILEITTTLNAEFEGIGEAPMTGEAFWRRMGEWEVVSTFITGLSDLSGPGLLSINEDGDAAISVISGTANEIDVTDGDAALSNPTIGLSDLTNTGVGDTPVKIYTRDSKGRIEGDEDADTDNLPEGVTNLYFTDERAQDAIGTILADSADIEFTYDDATPEITAELSAAMHAEIDSKLDYTALKDTLVAGTNITLTEDDIAETITIESTGGGGGVPEAPTDGAIYGRQNGAWVVLVPAPIPENTVLPVVSGATYVGDTASTTDGTWTNSPTSYAYQWQEWDAINSEWDDIVGETSSTFGPIMAIGDYRVQVIATNTYGDSDPAYSTTFVITTVPAGTPFTASWQADLSNSDMTVTRGTSGTVGYGHAWTDVITGKFYFEIECDGSTGVVPAVGVWMVDTVTPQPWWDGGDFSFQGGSTLKSTLGDMFSFNYYGDTAYIGTDTPDITDDPIYRLGWAVDATTGEVWIRQVWSTGASAWFGTGSPDPVTGTDATFTLVPAVGFEDVRIAVSVDTNTQSATIIDSGSHLGAAPSGFTPI